MDYQPWITTYPDIGEAALGPRGRTLVSVVLYGELCAVAVEFVILEGDNLQAVFPKLTTAGLS